ncbi:phytanoyl-CoA dioxygenase family protein [uncultured Sneathiella sp.]|uniref:phytanoyl-CoA dioxygenase family protein n=1 Tax=uncultured Sneathiella sp. TaxID=879315 RepID=UPI0030ED0963|tara:strand:- start:26468 stop:27223 length:756 start_codon:yes stop_codon:yes gene_type:complete
MLDAYRTNGFCVSEPVFAADKLSQLAESLDCACKRAAIDKEMAESCVFERDQPADKRDGVEVGEDENAIFIIGDIVKFCPDALPFIIADDIVKMVSEILQTTDVIAHLSNLTMKSPRIGSGINWHRDYPNRFISPVAPAMVRTMICVDGMTEAIGATRFLKQSHLPSKNMSVPDDYRAGDVITATCAPGSVVAIHPRILHGGGPNKAATPRRNIVIQWGREDVPLATRATESITGKTVYDLRAACNIPIHA